MAKSKPKQTEVKRLYSRITSRLPVKIAAVGVLQLRNLSFDGALLSATAAVKKKLPLGAIVHLTLDAKGVGGIALVAGVVRHDAAGVAVVWNAPEPADARRLAQLCVTLAPPRPAPSKAKAKKLKGRRRAR